MPQQVDSAKVMMLDCITEDDIGRKLRVAGRMLTYDPESALVLLHDARSALLVDVTLCIDTEALLSLSDAPKNRDIDHRWALERKGYVWVIGHLERVEDQMPIPILPAYLAPPDIDPSLVMRAVIVAPAKDLNTTQLRAALAEMAEVPPTPYPVW
ncbi:hypothetical protein V8B97DRAFT_725237 [Scleroderma yunnanense]